MQRHCAHLVIRAVEVEHTEVGHHPVHVDEAVGWVVGIDLVPTYSGHDIDRVTEHPLGVIAHPVAGGVVDRVAGCAPDPEHLAGGMLQRSERRQVLVAVTVDLVGAHHHMASAPGQCLEHPPEGHPALDRRGCSDGGGVGDEPRLAVGQQDVGGEGQPSQPGADRHDGGHRADHDLAGVTEQFGTGDCAHLGAGCGHHFCASFCSSANARTAAW